MNVAGGDKGNLIVGVPRERAPGERRVSLVPQLVRRLTDRGLEVLVERGAGLEATFPDSDYEAQGAGLADSAEDLYGRADVVLKVGPPVKLEDSRHEVDLLREGTTLIGFLNPLVDLDLVRRLAARRITAFAMELMPRITRAQGMDALSSMSTVAGYRAALIAADRLPRFFPMLMTAAGTVTPARVLVLGAGVAGLQAIATARRLGAVVEGFDIRPAVREQVESLGARFVEVDLKIEGAEDAGGYAREQTEETQARLRAALAEHIVRADVVITTALVPGKRAPLLIEAATAGRMKRGAVIVDLAAEQGGNCELTRPGEDVVHEGVTICGPLNLPATLPVHASEMYARNISAFLLHLVRDGELVLDLDDELTRGPLVTRDGEIVDERVRKASEEGGSSECPNP